MCSPLLTGGEETVQPRGVRAAGRFAGRARDAASPTRLSLALNRVRNDWTTKTRASWGPPTNLAATESCWKRPDHPFRRARRGRSEQLVVPAALPRPPTTCARAQQWLKGDSATKGRHPAARRRSTARHGAYVRGARRRAAPHRPVFRAIRQLLSCKRSPLFQKQEPACEH